MKKILYLYYHLYRGIEKEALWRAPEGYCILALFHIPRLIHAVLPLQPGKESQPYAGAPRTIDPRLVLIESTGDESRLLKTITSTLLAE